MASPAMSTPAIRPSVPGGLVVWEEAVNPVPPPGLTLLDRRRYGETVISILESRVPLPSFDDA